LVVHFFPSAYKTVIVALIFALLGSVVHKYVSVTKRQQLEESAKGAKQKAKEDEFRKEHIAITKW
jgi:hypothetical protein